MKFEKTCREPQVGITKAIEEIDGGATLKEDAWVRATGGVGMSVVLTDGNVWEKTGVNLSVVYGTMPREALQSAAVRGVDHAKGMKPGDRVPFFACGLCRAMHPKNPFCPTMHFNDRYFHIKHCGETRGLGGIFFDDQSDRDPDTIFEFSKECLNNVVNAYGPMNKKHKDNPFTQEQKEWQLMRRGCYVEFNLSHDRGIVFGLKTGGRIESTLMSLPRTAWWEYNHQIKKGSPEADLIDATMNPTEWV